VAWLARAAVAPATLPEARREAVLALTASRAIDATLAGELFAHADWQIRRLALLAAPADAALIDLALKDADGHVRLEAARLYGRHRLPAASCAPLLEAARDADTHVALAAIDALDRCEDTSADAPLASLAATPGGPDWHRASHALVTLASLDRTRARTMLPAHMADAAWPVRMYAADAAGHVRDDDALEALAGDAHPNVREAAIARLTSRAAAGVAVGFPSDLQPARRARLLRVVASALTDLRDPQLIRTAALAVKETGDPASLEGAIVEALAALDAEGADTTADARAALVEALKIAAPDAAVIAPPVRKAPETPSAADLRALPVRARVEMARGGAFELELLPDEAPATVARFARLARAGYFDGLTFHRVVPNFVLQGGSPWANEYAGAPRYQRDEVGFARHERGAVGISTRGRDTGDAQIFIDLVDLPRLNHDYTVFARVVSGMDVVDRILEADVIQRVSILR
jgi:cyclophilin family peptidyl-prolyl cis-trans isomerase